MKTIFAPITAISNSAVIVIRISGPKTLEVLQHLGINKKLIHKQATLTRIYDPDSKEELDQILVTFFKSPNSFTGQDVAEINIHGSIYITRRIIDILAQISNVRIANAGEFTKIAFSNGKMDLVEAQAIADLINSETKEQHRQSLRQINGDLSRIYEKWRFDLIKIMANLEAFIDFPDEDLPKNIIIDIEDKVKNLKLEILSHLDDNNVGQKIKNGLNLAIIGDVNVGKSSLINFFAKSEVAIVTQIAGTTRDVIEISLEIAGLKVNIADTAGIRETEDLVEKEGIKRSLKKANEADLKILVIDVSKINEFNQENLKLIDDDSLILFNKSDLGDFKIPKYFTKFKNIKISIKNKSNLDTLIKNLEDKVRKLSLPTSDPIITAQRYRYSLKESVENLEKFSLNKPIELASEDLRIAALEIGKITGKVDVENILDLVFSNFCIGK